MTLSAMVEEDPSSQFVDFTNATALEQFVADLEQTLIQWQLADKGHAAAGGGRARRLQLGDAYYALSLFAASSSSISSSSSSNETKKWQQGLEHFTPTMLAIADTTRDFRWRYAHESAADAAAAAADEPLGGSRALLESVGRWFGVDSFVFLSRAAPPTSHQRANREAAEITGEGGAAGDESATELLVDVAVESNEAALLLSALTIALSNCNCTLPAFVPTFEPSRGAWLGSAVPGATGNVSIAFETDATPEVSSTQSCISGLLDFFKLKLQLPVYVEEKYRVVAGGAADATDVPIGMLVSAAFGYSWTRAEDPREVASEPPTAAASAAASSSLSSSPEGLTEADVKAPADIQRERVLRCLFGGRAGQCVGAAASPLLGLDLTVIWRNLREGSYVDNVVHSSLDAKKAPEWLLAARFQRLTADNERRPQLPLSKVVANLVQAYSNSRELSKDILVSELAPNMPTSSSSGSLSSAPSSSSGGGAPLSSSSRLPESIPAARAAVVIGNAIGTLTSSLVSAATWKGADVDEIRRVVAELFEDELELADAAEARDGSPLSSVPVAHSAPVGELVAILACRMGQLHGLNAMSLLWVEFVKALRERWFQLRLLPAMCTVVDGADGQRSPSTRSLDTLFLLDSQSLQLPAPDFHQCLLHQKLQLLNCCILRQAEITRSSPPEASPAVEKDSALLSSMMSDLTSFTFDYREGEDDSSGDSPGSDDEFFDSIEQQESSSHSSQPPAAAAAAEGALRPIPGVSCLTTNAPVMEPITQAAVPMTEDVAKQQQELLSRLGGSAESAVLRQQLQSAALVSDMQAFKAANPGCCLADFIRWYSPKDWIPLDPVLGTAAQQQLALPQDGKDVWWFDARGMLSERMRFGATKQHLWQQMWERAAPVPVAQQRCLFDPMHEAEKIFHYLETISPHELFHQMLAGAVASALFTLETALPVASQALPVFHAAMRALRERSARAIALLDDALAESQVAFPAGKDQRDEHERAKGQLQVAFEMALDACWKLVLELERVEALLSHARALLAYFPPSEKVAAAGERADPSVALVNVLLAQALARESSGPAEGVGSDGAGVSELLKVEALRERVTTLVLLNPALSGPVQREYVLRCVSPRPFLRDNAYTADPNVEGGGDDGLGDGGEHHHELLEESPLVVNRMYAQFQKNTVRFALVLAESEF